uniref:G-protein coupled receptors family 1 profile domain-containing protein n=1 Tax=Nannospalax galili TaxID=1026970 RepID=A0A8C6QGA7_NANGA
MAVINESHPEEFILLGFADHPWLDLPLYIFLLVTYPLALVGNITIILVSTLDSHLHSPMYVFLINLSFLDMCYTTSIVPQMLFNLGGSTKTISYMGCVVYLYVFHITGGMECPLLAIMSFDCYMAIFCILLVSLMWLIGVIFAFSEATLKLQMPLSGVDKLDHLCEIPVLIKMACREKEANELALSVVCTFILAVPLYLILASYVNTGCALLKIKSSEGRKKAFGTYIVMHLQPSSSITRDQQEFMALFYAMMMPARNPFIYTLRNKDVKGALRKLLRSIFSLK